MQYQYEQALTDFDQAIKLQPDSEVFLRRRGETYLLMGKYDDALGDFNKGLIINPESDWCYYQSGLIDLLLENNEEAKLKLNMAIDLATSVYEKDPQNWYNKFDLLFYHLAMNHVDKVDNLYNQILSESVPNYILAEAHLYFELLLRLFPEHLGAKKIYSDLEDHLHQVKNLDFP